MEAPPAVEPANAGRIGSALRSAMVWNLASMAMSQLVLSVLFILLAGQLKPEVFGLFALAVVLVDFYYVLACSAGADAVVQRQDFSARTLSTASWSASGVSAIAAVLLVMGSGLIASMVGEPQVTPVLIALALSVLIAPLVIAPTAVMRHKLDFRGLAIRGIIASLAGAVAALAIAYTPWRDWALVAQRWVSLGAGALMIILHTRVTPKLEFDVAVSRGLLGVAGRIFAGQGVGSAPPRVLDLIVGATFGPAILGCLRVASKLGDVLVAALVNPIGQMWLVFLSRTRNSPAEGRAVFLQLSKVLALIVLPGFLGAALVADEFVSIVLKPDYEQVGPLLAILGSLGLFIPLTNSRSAILTALSRLNMLLVFSVLDLVAAVVGMLLVRDYGPLAVVLVGCAMPNVASLIFGLPYLLNLMAIRARDFAAAMVPPYLAAAVMCVGVIALDRMLPSIGPWGELIGKAVLGATLYIGFLALFFRRWTIIVVKGLSNREIVRAA